MIPPIARRFVAGESAVDVLERTRDLNDRGIGVICNRLGEHYDRPEPAGDDVRDYRRLLQAFDERDLRGRISAKPTQLGLEVDESTFRTNLAELVEVARETGGFVWVDMEGPETTEATVSAFEDAAPDHPGGLGLCLQANLARTEDDVDRLADVPAHIRLVKGAYDPPPGEGVRGRDAVRDAYEDRLRQLLATLDGVHQGVAIGTHDDELIDVARSLAAEHGVDLELQMLMGVREDDQERLADEFDVWQYVPYGERWAAYFSRRVAERRENVLFALRAVLGR